MTRGIYIRGGRWLQLMYIQLSNPEHTSVLLKGSSTRLPFLSYDPSLKATQPSRGTHPMRPVPPSSDGFPPHKFYHRHSPPPNHSSNGQCNTPINFLGTLSRRKVLSFTVNCNSGLCYMSNGHQQTVLNRHRQETCTQGHTLLHPPIP
jgi:hypothetical protein